MWCHRPPGILEGGSRLPSPFSFFLPDFLGTGETSPGSVAKRLELWLESLKLIPSRAYQDGITCSTISNIGLGEGGEEERIFFFLQWNFGDSQGNRLCLAHRRALLPGGVGCRQLSHGSLAEVGRGLKGMSHYIMWEEVGAYLSYEGVSGR